VVQKVFVVQSPLIVGAHHFVPLCSTRLGPGSNPGGCEIAIDGHIAALAILGGPLSEPNAAEAARRGV
jgi:hypothetical protein